jgi:hypothetical protein
MLQKIKNIVLNKSFLLGIILATGLFSKYIFGPNNFAEELSELLLKINTSKDVNFSPEVPEKLDKDLNRLW